MDVKKSDIVVESNGNDYCYSDEGLDGESIEESSVGESSTKDSDVDFGTCEELREDGDEHVGEDGTGEPRGEEGGLDGGSE